VSRLHALADELDLKAGELFGVIRAAVTGNRMSPPLFDTPHVLGRERSLTRTREARQIQKAALASKI